MRPVEVEQGPCLLEFFQSRWRRANDVRRWDEAMNEVAGCAQERIRDTQKRIRDPENQRL